MKQISAGLHHTLVLLDNGDVYSFGSTKYGQLDHQSMAVNDENKVYTWGFYKTYALRNQSKNDELFPFELKYEEFGEILEFDGGSQYSNKEGASQVKNSRHYYAVQEEEGMQLSLQHFNPEKQSDAILQIEPAD
ncbi:40279_t:CDS:2 [Gigaspora margarita]|uniref:40279_t:CDS:1 n=1 Tax=Gigaspora margarita TaxID=4874 RepID=A0ABN7UND5_GIGMA|nr:40279_t:CDS:2 [Gigaspora margarita]